MTQGPVYCGSEDIFLDLFVEKEIIQSAMLITQYQFDFIAKGIK